MWNNNEIKVVRCPNRECDWKSCPHKEYHNEYYDCISHNEICPPCEKIKPFIKEKDLNFDL